MDPITHGALGAACAQSALYPHDKHNVWIIGAIAAMAPDLDIAIRSASDPTLFLKYHRHFTHALLFIPLGGILVALFLLLFPRFRKHWKVTLFASLIGYSTHSILDALTSYGTVLYWPFSEYRVAWDIVAIVDPLFTLPLILGVIYTQVRNDRKGVFIGLSLAVFLLLFNGLQHHRAVSAVNNYVQQQRNNIKKLRLFPKLASSMRWRAAIIISNQLLVGDVKLTLFNSGEFIPLRWFPLAKTDYPITTTYRKDLEIFRWFADEYLIALCDNPLLVVDGRYLSEGQPLVGLWGLQFLPHEGHASLLRSIYLDQRCPIL